MKYQYQGLVPQAEAPRLSGDGKTFAMKATSSGQSALEEFQKKVSNGTEMRRPTTVPVRTDGMMARRRRPSRA